MLLLRNWLQLQTGVKLRDKQLIILFIQYTVCIKCRLLRGKCTYSRCTIYSHIFRRNLTVHFQFENFTLPIGVDIYNCSYVDDN